MSFCQLSELQIRTTCDQIILKCAAITGCPMPQTDYFAEIITKELSEYLNEFEFGVLTFEEMLLAMRLNARGGLRHPGNGSIMEKILFSGACFNVNFLSEVLSNYMFFRDGLDRKFQNIIDGY